MSELLRPIIIPKSELFPEHVELHDALGFSPYEPTNEQIEEAFIRKDGGMPLTLDYRHVWLKEATHDFYAELVQLGTEEIVTGEYDE